MMYSPPHFQVEDKEKVLEFVRQNSFATLISCGENTVSNISKIPLMLKDEEGQLYLEGHFARPNPHWKYLMDNPSVTVMFDGPHDYISPSWYENPTKDVPTWNYSTVIMKGVAGITDSSEWLLQSVMELSDKFENDSSWKDSVDKDFLRGLSKGIVGIKIQVKEIQSKFKLSQNRSELDKNNVMNELSSRNEELAELMRSI